MSMKSLGLAIATSCLLYSGANAAGLGKITVLSALGQPLRAEIELTSIGQEDVGNMVLHLASQEAYRQANVDFNAVLRQLSFSVEHRGARTYVLVTSSVAVDEPFLEILVELNSSSGKLIREYTVLLDPAELTAKSNAPLSTSGGTTVSMQPVITPTATPQTPADSTPAPAATTPAPVAPAPTTPASPAPTKAAPAPAPAATGDTYQIKNGDTLSKIANQYKPAGVSLEQMLVALQRSNASAFIDHNMNLLRSGRILTIPDEAAIEQTTTGEAHKIVLAQSSDFSAYRNRMANQVEQAAPEKTVEPKKTDSGKITAKVTEAPTPVSESKDKLKLSKAQADKEAADRKAAEEEKIAKQRALDAANARVKELEANTAKLQNILDMKNKAAKASAAAAAEKNEKPATATPAVTASAPTSLPAVEASVPASKPVVKPRPKAVAPAPAPEPQPSMFDLVKNNSLYIGAVLLAVLGGAGLLMSKRKKKKEDSFEDESMLTGSSIKTNSLFGSTGGQSVDTNNSVFNSNFAPSASQLDANEVDPVAEADVYIAYGRDEQAEEILKEALRTQPDRQAVRVKLLEIYAHRKDARTFESVASDLYGMTGGEGPDWAQAASLGIMIDPQNPLYAGGQSADHSTAALGASTLPVESLDPEALLGNSLSQEMLDSIAVKDGTVSSLLMGGPTEAHGGASGDEGLDFDLGLSTHPDPDADFGMATKSPLSEDLASALDFAPTAVKHDLDMPAMGGQHDLDVTAGNLSATTPLGGMEHTAAAAVEAVEPAAEPAADMGFGALDFDFNLSKDAKPAAEDHVDHEKTHVDTGRAAAGSVDYDLSSINLDLPKVDDHHDAHLISDEKTLEIPQQAIEEVVDFSGEMATKLDLAIAYQEIGDKDGARELLEEVIKGGSDEQVGRAKSMMKELG